MFKNNTDNDTATIDGTTYSKTKAAYVLVTCKRPGAGGTLQLDGTQVVKVPLTITSDADNFDGTITNASEQTILAHVNQAISNVVPETGQISVKDGSGSPLGENTNPSGTLNGWKFAGWVKDDADHTALTNNDIDLTANDLTNGVKTAHAYAKIELKDGSYVYSSTPIDITVYGGYEKTISGSTISYPTTTDNGTALTDDDAQIAIANANDLNDKFHATGESALKYEWSTGGANDPIVAPDVTYREGATGVEGTKLRTANVIITYGDGTKQAVQVHYNVNSDADIVFPASSTVTSSDISTHVVNTGTVDGSNLIDGDTKVKITNDGSTATKKISKLGYDATIAWKTNAGPDLLQADTAGTNRTATITFADGSTKDITINVKVAAATAKTAAPAVNSTQAQDEAWKYVDLPSEFGVDSNTRDIKWIAVSDDSGKYTVTSTTPSYNTTWASDHTTEQAYVEIDYADGKGSQIVPITLNLTSSHDGINANLATDANIVTHVGASVAEWTDSTGTTTATLGNAQDYVHLTYGTDTSATNVDLSHLGQSTSPIKSITWETKPDVSIAADASANKKAKIKIEFTDGSAAKTVEVPYTVLGGDGQLTTQAHQDTITQTAADVLAKTAITNNRDLNSSTGHTDGWTATTYQWCKSDGTILTGADLNNLFKNNTDSEPDQTIAGVSYSKTAKAYIRIGYSDDTHEIVEVPLKITSDADNYTVASSGISAITTHVGATHLMIN